MTHYLTLEDVLVLCQELGLSQNVRDIGLLDSAVHRPRTSLFGEDAYPSLHTKAAVLMESLVRNHALVDGNKRLGWVVVVVFYALNGVELRAPEEGAYDLVIATSTGAVDFGQIAAALARWAS